MSAKSLPRRTVERIWGRRILPAGFAEGNGSQAPIGEIWFEDEPGAALLAKYLFTSERLSIQVHPGDAAALAAGHARGKDEAWFILEAEAGAVIGLGLKSAISKDALRAAALDGDIEDLIDWRPVARGDVIYSPAGTIHAIGSGLALIEIQQNIDLTYRLYDYGRPRELHVEEAVAVARPGPRNPDFVRYDLAPGRTVVAAGSAFTLEHWRGARAGRIHAPAGADALIVPLAGALAVDGALASPGTVWSVSGSADLVAGPDADLLAAYPGVPREAAFS